MIATVFCKKLGQKIIKSFNRVVGFEIRSVICFAEIRLYTVWSGNRNVVWRKAVSSVPVRDPSEVYFGGFPGGFCLILYAVLEIFVDVALRKAAESPS